MGPQQPQQLCADPWEPQWAFPHQPQQLWQTLASAPQPRSPPPPTDTCRTPGSASRSTREGPSPSWEPVSARLGGSGQVAWLCPPASSPESGECPWGQVQALQRMHLPLWVPVVLGGPHVRPLRGQPLSPKSEPPEDPSINSPHRNMLTLMHSLSCHSLSHSFSHSLNLTLTLTHFYSHSCSHTPTYSCLFLHTFTHSLTH